MATILDTLIVLLKLDPAGVAAGRKRADEELARARESAKKTGDGFDDFTKRSTAGLSKLKNEAVGLFLAFQGASSLTGFIQTVVLGDAATGRLAANLGVGATRLSAWQLAVKEVGGSAKDANDAMSALAEARNNYLLTGTTGHDPDFKGLGVSLGDLKAGPDAVLLRLAEAAERMDKTEFFARASRLGLPPSVINTLEKGRDATDKLVKSKEAEGAASLEETRKAAELEKKLAELSAQMLGKARPAIYALVDGLLAMGNNTQFANVAVPILTGLVGAAAIAAGLAYAPFFALAGVIAAAVAQYELWQKLRHMPESDRKKLEDRSAQIRQQAWDAFNTKDDISVVERFGRAFGVLGAAIPEGVHALDGKSPGGGGGGGGRAQGDVAAQFSTLERAFGHDRARGIWAGVGAESKWDAGAHGPGPAAAYGLGQWVGSRKRALFAKYGPNPSAAEQIQFLISELRGGDPGGAAVLGQNGSENTMVSYLRDFMRPQGAHNEHYADLVADVGRGRRYLGLTGARAPVGGGNRTSSSTMSVGTIVVHTAATDADGVAAALPGAITRRGLTNQGNRGLD